MYPDLRHDSAEQLVAMDFPGYAIGGLSVGEPRALTQEIIESTLPVSYTHLPLTIVHCNAQHFRIRIGNPQETTRPRFSRSFAVV